MPEKQRIFISGASSEVMQRFVSRIDSAVYEVIGLTRNLEDKTKRDGNPGNIVWVEGDIRDTGRIEKYLKGCQIVIHSAAVTHANRPKKYFEINQEATGRLVDLVVKNNQIKKFIFISSRAAVPGSGAYGQSKLRAEQYVIDKLGNWLIFRLSEMFEASVTHDFISKMTSDVIERRVVLCPTGMPRLFPIHVDDAARIMNDLVFHKNICNEVVTINGLEGYSLKELLRCAGEVCDKRIIIIPIPKWIMLSCAKLLGLLPIKLGIAPDQIARLYSVKDSQTLDYGMLSVRDYLQSRCNRSSDDFSSK